MASIAAEAAWDLGVLFCSSIYVWFTVIVLLLLRSFIDMRSFRHIPTVGGPSLPILSYIGVYSYYYRNKETFQEGYDKYQGRAFKLALLDQWAVVITGKQLVEELSKMPEEQASFVYGVTEMTGMLHAFGEEVWHPPYHVNIIRSVLTRHINPFFGDIYNEIETAFYELIPTNETDWIPVRAIHVVRDIVARVSGRVFVGLPLCHDPDYLDIAKNLAMDFGVVRRYFPILPASIKPLFARYVSSIDQRIAQMNRVLGPTIAERMERLKEHGKDDYPDKPNDMVMWITEEAVERGQDIEVVIRTLLFAIFASIHTSSNIFTHALYHVAANPEFAEPLRQEVEEAIRDKGWTKAAMGRMHKMDSLFRECMRYNGIHTSSLNRKALVPITLSNGTYIPQGTLIIVPTIQTHYDSTLYDNPEVFDPWRFANPPTENDTNLKQQFVTTSTDYIAFGHGKHACPGRFFAANELKAMMAHLVLNYDVKFANGVRPEDAFGIMSVSPNPAAKVFFRKRKTAYL